MVSLGTLSLDGTKLAGNAAQKASRTLPQIEKVLAEATAADVAGDAKHGSSPQQPATPRTLARRAGRRERLARARDRLAAEDKTRRDAQRAKQEPRPRPRQPGSGAGAAQLMSRRARTAPAPGRGRTPPTRTSG